MHTSKVSIIIPTYNRANLVSRAIFSVLAQTHQNFEIIVVDDASSDHTQNVVESFRDSRIKYTRHDKNTGIAVARNTGIAKSDAAFVAFLDDDDEWLPHKLEKQLQAFMSADEQVGVCYTWIKSCHETGNYEQAITPTYEGFIFEDLLYSCFTNTSSLMIKRECLRELGAFDESSRSCEDWDLVLRLSQHYKFIVVPEILSIYWNHNSAHRLTHKYTSMLDAYINLLGKYAEMKTLPDTFRKIGTSTLQQKSNYFAERGNRYMHWAILSNHPEGLTIAKKYLKSAFLANPQKLSLLAYYIVSAYFENQYLNFTKMEHALRKQKYYLLANLKQKFSTVVLHKA